MKLTDKSFAERIGITPRAVLEMKKIHPDKYRRLRLGVLCEEMGLDEEDLLTLLENRQALQPLLKVVEKLAVNE